MNRPTVCFCESCHKNVHFTGELRPSAGDVDPPKHRRDPMVTFLIATIVLVLIGIVVWWFLAALASSGLSDS